jgi:hypothetical protein
MTITASEFQAVRYPVAPSVTRRKSTLLDVATPDDAAFTWNDGLALFESFNCMTFHGNANFCAPNTKDLSGASTWQDGFRFAAYGGYTCRPIGMADDAEAKVREAFENGESFAVEAAMVSIRFAVNAAGDTPLPGAWPAPASIGTAVATDILLLSALEEYGATHYNGYPVLHLPVGIASRLTATEALVWDGNILRTKYGSKVAVGAGYSANDPKKAYVTGEVLIGKSEQISLNAIDTTNNNMVVLAERGYIAAVDCFAATLSIT